MKNSTIYALAFGVISASCIAKPATAAPKQPFRAIFDVTEQLAPSPVAGCYLIGTVSGKGLVSNMGKATATAQDCITPSGVNFLFYSREHLILLAGNAEQIWVCYKGTLAPASQGVYSIEGTYKVVGGTGTFHGATGSGTLQGLEDLSGGLAVPTRGGTLLNGTIAYGTPNSSKNLNCASMKDDED